MIVTDLNGAIVWIVSQREGDAEWELGGIYSTEDEAKAACTQPGDGYWSVTVGKDLGRETQIMGVVRQSDGTWHVGGPMH